MSAEPTTPETEPASAKKKKGGLMKKALFALVLLGAGGGGTYAAFAGGMLGDHETEEDARPQLVLKDAEDPYAPASGEGGEEQAPVVHGTGGSKYRTAYYDFTDEFTSNLAGGSALVQLSLAASTHYDGRVLMWLGEHETALRSRILAELAATDEMDLTSVSGKERLQKRLAASINEVLEEREGFGGVDNVYFRSFIVQ